MKKKKKKKNKQAESEEGDGEGGEEEENTRQPTKYIALRQAQTTSGCRLFRLEDLKAFVDESEHRISNHTWLRAFRHPCPRPNVKVSGRATHFHGSGPLTFTGVFHWLSTAVAFHLGRCSEIRQSFFWAAVFSIFGVDFLEFLIFSFQHDHGQPLGPRALCALLLAIKCSSSVPALNLRPSSTGCTRN